MAAKTTTRRHVCDTESPSRPCCWEAYNREAAEYAAADAARVTRYGRTSCACCGRVYEVRDGAALDHACEPMSADRLLGC